jgi:hypothetical protein
VSTSIYEIKYEDLTWGHEFAEWLSDKASRSEGDLKYLETEQFEEALKKTTKKFRTEHKKQIVAVRKRLDETNGGFDFWVSW